MPDSSGVAVKSDCCTDKCELGQSSPNWRRFVEVGSYGIRNLKRPLKAIIVLTWTAKVCDTIYGPPRSVDYTVKWKGCVGSRDVPLNTQAAFNNRRIPGLLGVSCGTEIRELTNNLSQVKSTINALAARGNTYMPSGLVWGWRALDGGQPLPSRAPSGITETDRVLVLMTDGQNTKSKTGNFHNGNNSAEADNTTRTLCTNIKREDITVFTIAYDVSDNTTKSLIRQCASSNAMFFDADNAKDLDEAFQEIAENLSNLRITS